MGGGLDFDSGRFNRAFNNIVVKGGTEQFHGTLATSNDSCSRNVFVGSYLYGTCCFASGTNIPAYLRANMPLYDLNDVDFSGSSAIITSWGGTSALYNWSQWTAAGMDAHSIASDPQFSNVNKTWPNYSPVGDYSVTASAALHFGLRKFPHGLIRRYAAADDRGAKPACLHDECSRRRQQHGPLPSRQAYRRACGRLSSDHYQFVGKNSKNFQRKGPFHIRLRDKIAWPWNVLC